jgi:hypothetical protein
VSRTAATVGGAAVLLLLYLVPAVGLAQVRVVSGPTPIPDGDARASGDLTVINDKLAFALAVDSVVPYGVPRGALVDIAPVRHGRIERDRVAFADFIPNNWSAWPNTYHQVDVLERGPRQARIRVVRDWGKVVITTVYTLQAHSDQVEIHTSMLNGGDTVLTDLLSGLTLWPRSGFLFAVPGLAGITEGSATAALARRVSAYDADWAVTLHAPYLDHIGSGSRDLWQLHSLKPHEMREFTGWLQVGASGDLSPVLRAELGRARLGAGRVRGAVNTRDGRALPEPVIVVERAGKPFAWALGHHGHYQLLLPPGEYRLYATGKGYSRSAAVLLSVPAGSTVVRDFRDLRRPGRVAFSVTEAHTQAPLDARITISEGEQPLVGFLGRRTFFTELEPRGRATVALAPGDYVFNVSSGAGFLAADVPVSLKVRSDQVTAGQVVIAPLFHPPARGWYAADLHHHADRAEAVTPPADVARSQLAAGLDLLFVSDHDSTANHATLQSIAAARGMPFIPGIELSPSWGHFNAYPLALGVQLNLDTSTASVDELFREARRAGASIVQVNHPFIPFGYLTSVKNGVAPGGFNAGFDLLEINSSQAQDDDKVLGKLWELWNSGQHYYLSAGSDTHDVWNEQSGRVRAFVHVEGALSSQKFADALKAGHAYVSYGPLIFPGVSFGEELPIRAGEPFDLAFELDSTAGISKVELIHGGSVQDSRSLADAPTSTSTTFTLSSDHAGWYSLIVEDHAGRKAYSDPIWVKLQPSQH